MGGGGVAGSPPAKGARGDSQLQGLPLPPWEWGRSGWTPGTVESRPRGRAAAGDRDSGWAGRQGRGADQRRAYLVLEAHLPGGAVRREAKEAGRDAGRGARRAGKRPRSRTALASSLARPALLGSFATPAAVAAVTTTVASRGRPTREPDDWPLGGRLPSWRWRLTWSLC